MLGAYQYIVTQLLALTGLKKKEREKYKADEDGFIRTSLAAGLTEKAKTIVADSLWGYDIDATMVRLGLPRRTHIASKPT